MEHKFDRNAAFSLNIKDPDTLDDKSRVVEMVTIDGKFLIFKSSGIYQGLTADTIDPERKHPDTRHSHEKLYEIGANNSYVARMVLQFKDIIGLTIQDVDLRDKLLKHIWKANKFLLECESAQYSIYKDVMELMPKCDEIIENNKTKPAIPALPKVKDLNNRVESFLNNGKLFLISTFEVLHIIYRMPFSGYTNSHFDKHTEWVGNKFGLTDPIYILLTQDKKWNSFISAARNAIQHPEEGQEVEIQNITLNPENKFSNPAWRYDLTKKDMGKQIEFIDLTTDLNVHLSNLLTFFEELLILCLKKELNTQHSSFDIYRKSEADIRPECPIAYMVQKKHD